MVKSDTFSQFEKQVLKLCKDILTQRTFQKMGMEAHGVDVSTHAEGGYDLADWLLQENNWIQEFVDKNG